MSDHNEKISSILDDYRHTDSDQSDLNELIRDVNQQYRLRRYQLIGDVMRNEMPSSLQLDFAAAVSAKIAQEPVLNAEPITSLEQASDESSTTSWLWSMLFKPVAGLAVAAAVAVVTVSTLQLNSVGNEQPEQYASAESSQAKVEQLAQLPVLNNAVKVSGNGQATESISNGTNWKIKRSEPNMQVKLNTYLINHNEYSNSFQGIIPQARVVGFDGQR